MEVLGYVLAVVFGGIAWELVSRLKFRVSVEKLPGADTPREAVRVEKENKSLTATELVQKAKEQLVAVLVQEVMDEALKLVGRSGK